MSSEPITNIREWLAGQIRDEVPDTWDVKAGLVSKVGTIARPTVYLEYTSIDPTGLPAGAATVGVDVIVVSPLTDVGKAEDDVDELVLDLVLALDHTMATTAHLTWRDKPAAKNYDFNPYLGWRLELAAVAALARPEPTPDPDPEE